jgi:hypothetical protein
LVSSRCLARRATSSPSSSGYSITQLSDLQLASYTAAENENVTAVAFHPGVVDTDMVTDFWKPCVKDTPELAGAMAVRLSTPAARFLNGRYTTANWDVEELVKRQEKVVQKDLLKVKLAGILRRQSMLSRLTNRSAV